MVPALTVSGSAHLVPHTMYSEHENSYLPHENNK